MATVLLCAATASWAQADDKVVVTGTDGNPAQISIADISQITFDGKTMTIATASAGNKDFQITAVDFITFDLSASSIDDIVTPLDDITVSSQSGVLTVSAAADVPLTLNVYNLKGILVSSQTGSQSLSVDFNALPAGVYIVKANNKTIKYTR